MGADTHWPRLFSTVSYWYFRLSSHFCWGKPSNESDMSQVCLRTLEHRTCSLFDNNDSYVMMLVIINRTKMPILNATTSYFPTSLSTSFAYLFPRLSWVVRRHVRSSTVVLFSCRSQWSNSCAHSSRTVPIGLVSPFDWKNVWSVHWLVFSNTSVRITVSDRVQSPF